MVMSELSWHWTHSSSFSTVSLYKKTVLLIILSKEVVGVFYTAPIGSYWNARDSQIERDPVM